MSILLLTPEFGNKNSELSDRRLILYLLVLKYLENVCKISRYISGGMLWSQVFSIRHKVSIWYICCMTSLLLEPSTFFPYISWSVAVTVIYHHSNPNPRVLKIEKGNKLKREWKIEKKIRWNWSPSFLNLTR